jgi:hypothetical protein
MYIRKLCESKERWQENMRGNSALTLIHIRFEIIPVPTSQNGELKCMESSEKYSSWVCRFMPVIQQLGRGRQKDLEFEASPGKVSRTLTQKQNKNKRA